MRGQVWINIASTVSVNTKFDLKVNGKGLGLSQAQDNIKMQWKRIRVITGRGRRQREDVTLFHHGVLEVGPAP